MMETRTALILQRPEKGLAPLEVDLALAYEAEARLPDIAHVNRMTAPGLVAMFTRAADHMAKVHARLEFEVQRATIASRRRRSIVTLDLMPQQVKERGLGSPRSPLGAEDIREALLYGDDEYCRIEEARAGLEAARELAFNKLLLLKGAARSCEKVLEPEGRGEARAAGHSGTLASGHQNRDPAANLCEEAMDRVARQEPTPSRAENSPTPPPARKGGWGIPKM
jgi:hypothetical protein